MADDNSLHDGSVVSIGSDDESEQPFGYQFNEEEEAGSNGDVDGEDLDEEEEEDDDEEEEDDDGDEEDDDDGSEDGLSRLDRYLLREAVESATVDDVENSVYLTDSDEEEPEGESFSDWDPDTDDDANPIVPGEGYSVEEVCFARRKWRRERHQERVRAAARAAKAAAKSAAKDVESGKTSLLGDTADPTATTTTAEPPTTFPQFARLPPELRLRVWELHCPAMASANAAPSRRRVVQVRMGPDDRLNPAATLARQTRAARRFMRICRETRDRGLQLLPDALPIGVSRHDRSVVRFDASRDVVHLLADEGWDLPYPGPVKRKIVREPHESLAHVRHLALFDNEIRTRPPGTYRDFRNMVSTTVDEEDASHRTPQEMRSPQFAAALVQLFPNLENLYVVEHGSLSRLNRWVGDTRPGAHATYRIRTSEALEYGVRSPIDYVYCWHPPPPGWAPRRPAEQPKEDKQKGQEAAEEKKADEDKEEDDEDEDDNEDGDGDRDDVIDYHSDEAPAGDFKEEAVLNHISRFKKRGVRFSRMLFFELRNGLERYKTLRALCRPDGQWPQDAEGRPIQDGPPVRDGWDSSVEHSDEEDEYESEGIDDEEIEEVDSDEEEDDLVVLSDDEDDGGGGDDDEGESDHPPLAEANFSSPEPDDEQPEEEAESSRRGKRRRVLADSDDEDGDGEVNGIDEDDEDAAGLSSASGAGPRVKRRRRAALSSDDDDDDADGNTENVAEGSHNADSRHAGRTTVISSDEDDDDSGDVSSHTEEGDDAPAPSKPLTLAQRLQLHRAQNPIPSDEEDEAEDEDEDEEEGEGDYTGDYGAYDEQDDDGEEY